MRIKDLLRVIAVMSLLGSALASPGRAAAAEPPLVGAPFPVSEISYTGAPFNQEKPDVVRRGRGFFSVWEDTRSWRRIDIWGSRLSATGRTLDRGGLPIATNKKSDTRPAVAYGAGRVLVVWQVGWRRRGPLRAALIDSNSGSILEKLSLQAPPEGGARPDVAFDGKRFTVVYQSVSEGKRAILGTRVSLDGDVLDPQGFLIHRHRMVSFWPRISSGDRTLLVVWGDTREQGDIYGNRLNRHGEPLDGNGFPISTQRDEQLDPSVTSNGSGWLVVWDDDRSYLRTGYDVFGARVSREGDVLDPRGIRLTDDSSSSWEMNADVSFDGDSYIVVWEYTRGDFEIAGVRVSTSGQVIGRRSVLATTNFFIADPVGASGPEGPIVVFRRTPDTPLGSEIENDVFGRELTASGRLEAVGDWWTVSRAPSEQFAPRAASSSDHVLATWTDTRYSKLEIRGRTLTSSPFEPSGEDRSLSENPERLETSAVAEAGGIFLTAWRESGRVYAVRTNESNEVLDDTPILLGLTIRGSDISATSNGDQFLIVWDNEPVEGPYTKIFGARVSRQGQVLEGPFVIGESDRDLLSPAAASNGSSFFVVWQSGQYSEVEGIFGARVNAAGDVLDPGGVPIAPDRASRAAVAWVPPNYLVAWSQSDAHPDSDIVAARVSTSGETLDCGGFPVASQPKQDGFASVVGVKNGAVIAWSNFDNEFISPDIHLVRLRNEGFVVDSSPISAVAAREPVYPPVLTSPSPTSDQAFLFYGRLSPEAPFNWTKRIFGRQLSPSIPPGDPATRPPTPCP